MNFTDPNAQLTGGASAQNALRGNSPYPEGNPRMGALQGQLASKPKWQGRGLLGMPAAMLMNKFADRKSKVN